MDTRLVLITAAVCLTLVCAQTPQQNLIPAPKIPIPPQQSFIQPQQNSIQPQQSFIQPQQNSILAPKLSIPSQQSFNQPQNYYNPQPQNYGLPQQNSLQARQSYNPQQQGYAQPQDYYNYLHYYRRLPAIEQKFNTYPDGSYDFNYHDVFRTARVENGAFYDIGEKDPALSVQGYYVYYSPEGQYHYVTYKADENGFQPQGNIIDPSIQRAVEEQVAYAKGERRTTPAPPTDPWFFRTTQPPVYY